MIPLKGSMMTNDDSCKWCGLGVTNDDSWNPWLCRKRQQDQPWDLGMLVLLKETHLWLSLVSSNLASCWTKITMELGLSNDIHDVYPLIDVMSVKIEPSHRWVSSFKICKISRIISAPGWWQNRKWWWVAHDALFFALILHAMTCSKVTKFRDIQAWTHGNLLFCRYQIFKSKPNWLEALASFSNRNMLDHLGPVCRTRFFRDLGSGFSEMSRTRQPKMAKNLSWQKRQEAFRFLL